MEPVEGRAAFQVQVQPKPRPDGRRALACSGLWSQVWAAPGWLPAQAEEGLWDSHPPAGPQPHS